MADSDGEDIAQSPDDFEQCGISRAQFKRLRELILEQDESKRKKLKVSEASHIEEEINEWIRQPPTVLQEQLENPWQLEFEPGHRKFLLKESGENEKLRI